VLFDLAERLALGSLRDGGSAVAAAVSVFVTGQLLALTALLWVWLGGVLARRP
jgi:hypothetical protein